MEGGGLYLCCSYSLESSNENKRDMLTRLGYELKKVDKERECKM